MTLSAINTTALKSLNKGLTAVQFKRAERKAPSYSNVQTSHDEYSSYGRQKVEGPSPGRAPERQQTVVRTVKKVGRNQPCPCELGKKFKHCCGK